MYKRLTFSVTLFSSLLAAPAAFAHFELQAPAAMHAQDAFGNPQKTNPCGPAPGSATTGMVTTYEAGQMIDITINETITHPGHYRVQLAQDMNGLPPQPPVTPAGGDDCALVDIDMTPEMPLLADGMLPHNTAFGAPQTFQVKLPDGFTCDDCVLQVAEYMRNHGAPCWYYHCAVVDIVAPGTAPDAGAGPGEPDAGGDGGDGGDDSSADGGDTVEPGDACACRAGGQRGTPAGALVILFGAVGLVLAGRRRSRR